MRLVDVLKELRRTVVGVAEPPDESFRRLETAHPFHLFTCLCVSHKALADWPLSSEMGDR